MSVGLQLYRFSRSIPLMSFFFFFNDTATTEIYTLSLHDALPIWVHPGRRLVEQEQFRLGGERSADLDAPRSEEHTSELQSRLHLVCRLLLEKKKKNNTKTSAPIQPRHAPESR